MKALDRKLARDLFALKGQVLTIAIVVACGMATWVSALGTWLSLQHSRDAYYERARLADVFAHLGRAPDSALPRLERLPGVARAYGRLVERALVPMEVLAEPAAGVIVSLPRGEQPPLDALHLRRGRLPEPGRSDEVVVLAAFADAHRLDPGAQLPVVLNGGLRRMTVVGVALSPEFVFAMASGAITTDAKRFAVLWMDRDALASAFHLEGAFDDVLVRLQPGASLPDAVAAIDRELVPFGGLGAHGRDREPSPRAVDAEIDQLRGMATFLPAIFVGVAAFLLNVVLARLVSLQRTQIAVLKAFGYTKREIGRHYLRLAIVIVFLGSLLGVALGFWAGSAWTTLYADYFHFPDLTFSLDGRVVASGLALTTLAGGSGAWLALRAAVRLPPAEAMQPPVPDVYRRSVFERLGLGHLLGPTFQMVLREIVRQPGRTALSVLGIALSYAVLVLGRYSHDSVDLLMAVQFGVGQREDVAVSLRNPVPMRDLSAFRALPGAMATEGLRMVPARARGGNAVRDVGLLAYPASTTLRRPFETSGRAVPLPARGALVTRKLAEILRLDLGDELDLEILEGQRRRVAVHVAGLVDEPLGLQIHMRLDRLSELLGEEESVTTALLTIDRAEIEALERRLRDVPSVAAVTRQETAIHELSAQMEGSTLAFAAILTAFAAAIAVGVVYNNVRVALSIRARDLATLRVLGFSRGEVAGLLFGETAFHVLLAVPLGAALAWILARLVMSTVDTEMYRFPVVVGSGTYAFAALVVIGSAACSGLLVKRKIDRLDMTSALKTRE